LYFFFVTCLLQLFAIIYTLMVENTALNPKVNNFSFYHFASKCNIYNKNYNFLHYNYSNKSSKNCIIHKNFNSVVPLVIEPKFNSIFVLLVFHKIVLVIILFLQSTIKLSLPEKEFQNNCYYQFWPVPRLSEMLKHNLASTKCL
jgi:hypothetical protein